MFGVDRKICPSRSLFGITRQSLVMPNSDPRTDFSICTSQPWKILIFFWFSSDKCVNGERCTFSNSKKVTDTEVTYRRNLSLILLPVLWIHRWKSVYHKSTESQKFYLGRDTQILRGMRLVQKVGRRIAENFNLKGLHRLDINDYLSTFFFIWCN